MKYFVFFSLIFACQGEGALNTGIPDGSQLDAGNKDDTGGTIQLCEESDMKKPEVVVVPAASAGRILRRTYLALRGYPPTFEQFQEIENADRNTQEALIETAIDEALASNDFYERMLDFGHHWMRNGRAINGTTGDAYMGNESTHLRQCGEMAVNANAYRRSSGWAGFVAETDICDDAAATKRTVEPWWAPGTSVTLLGVAASTSATGIDDENNVHDCGIVREVYYDMANANGCGCGPNAVWCYPANALASSNDREFSQRRDIWEEPARLVAHLAWHDQPLSDVVLGNYTVANNRLAAWYLRFGRQTGLYNDLLDGNTTWFKPDSGKLRDPQHPDPNDPEAWRELVVETLAPQLLSLSNGEKSNDPTRTLKWNPVDDAGPAPGLPSAGVLTMPGPNSTFPRERVRAARFIEIFSCRAFNPPPAEIHFPPIGPDIADSGQCMHCHVLMDPVAMAFRRWNFFGYYVPRPRIVGMENMPVPTDLFVPENAYTYGGWFRAGAKRWDVEWKNDTIMTPVSEGELESNPSALFYDTIPPQYSIYGEHPDGTMGPLGFAKVLVSSGEFDQCAVRNIYERFVGRELNPQSEAGYIKSLANQFAADDRKVKTFIKKVLMSDDFKRGW